MCRRTGKVEPVDLRAVLQIPHGNLIAVSATQKAVVAWMKCKRAIGYFMQPEHAPAFCYVPNFNLGAPRPRILAPLHGEKTAIEIPQADEGDEVGPCGQRRD